MSVCSDSSKLLKASATLPSAPAVTLARTVRSPSEASDTTERSSHDVVLQLAVLALDPVLELDRLVEHALHELEGLGDLPQLLDGGNLEPALGDVTGAGHGLAAAAW